MDEKNADHSVAGYPVTTATEPTNALEEKVQSLWTQEVSDEIEGPELCRAWKATVGLAQDLPSHEDRPFQLYKSYLEHCLDLFSGERAFFFISKQVSDEPVEIESCVASVDLDGDPVADPDRKVPTSLLTRCARSRLPVVRDLETARANLDTRSGSLMILPVVSRRRCRALLAIENRFQELLTGRNVIREAQIACQALASNLELLTLEKDNANLWRDLDRLRGSLERGHHVEVGAPVTTSERHRPARNDVRGDYSMIVGASQKVVEILKVIDRISGSTAPVLINGESGTGKELIALAVHKNSPRKNKTFVSENCGAITETLLESELFGYVKGAFTGANRDHKGLFELAVGGTLFLDEVGDMSPSMQKKLLRVLQERVIRRVGAKDFTPVDVRIISATNKDLMSECRAGNFREDLYYRLNVINLKLPPLRERSEDVPALVDHFLDQLTTSESSRKTLEPSTLQRLLQYSWPGNIRELQNEVRKLHALSDGDVIGVRDLSEHIRDDAGADPLRGVLGDFQGMTLKEATERLERLMIDQAMATCGGNKSHVAKALQIPKTSLYNKINKYKL